MPLQVPTLDDRSYEQILAEATRRIPSFTPEWTNFGIESDPGVTLVELFAFLTESLIYRANRIPERDQLKFLQLLGVPLQPAAAADGIVDIRNDRGPLASLPLNAGVVVSAGSVDFLTRDPVDVLPIEVQIYYKEAILPTDPAYAGYSARYEAILAATQAAQQDTTATSGQTAAGPTLQLAFYQTTPMSLPTAANPSPVLDLATNTMDRAIYLALLAPKNVKPDDVRPVIANQTLNISVVPALSGDVQSLQPVGQTSAATAGGHLVFEIASVQGTTPVAQYVPLRLLSSPDVLNATGIVQVQLPDVGGLQTWTFSDPQQEGTDDFPPKLEDAMVAGRVITWIRIRLAQQNPGPAAAVNGTATARLTWVGINATRVTQAVPIVGEFVGMGTGEPDQTFVVANTPVLPDSVTVMTQDVATGSVALWRMTDDLLAAQVEDPVFTLDPEAGQLNFGDGLHGARPQSGSRVLASYEYGGGLQGNVGIGAIKTSRDSRLQGGYAIENPISTSGGDIGQTVAQAVETIPQFLRHRDRAVTEQDFKDVVTSTPGVDVGRVEVLPLFLPSAPDTPAPGVVTVMVVPLFDAVRPLWPTPDRLFLQRVCAYLDQRRLVTTEIYVRGPQYVPVYLSVGIEILGGYFFDAVRQDVTNALNLYLSSLVGGPSGTGWPLSKNLIQKDLEAVATRVAGVDYVDSLDMGVNVPVSVTEFALSGLQLPFVAGLQIIQGPADPVSTVFGTPTQPPTPTVQVVPVPVSRATC